MKKNGVLLKANGRLFDEKALVGLTGIRVQQRLSLPNQCELYFREPPGPLTTAQLLPVGTSFEVRLVGFERPLFVGDVTAVEHEYGPDNVRQIYIRGYDPLHRLRKRQQVRLFEKKSFRDLARELAREIGIHVSVPAADLGWARLYQHQEDDFALLVNLAAQYGYYLTMREEELHIISLEGMGQAQSLQLGQSLLQVTIEENNNDAADEIRTTGWNTARLEMHTSYVRESRSGRLIKHTRRGGESTARRSHYLLNENTPTVDHARALAQAELDYRHASEVTLQGDVNGNPEYQPGTRIQITGVEPHLAGQYVITEAIHVLEAGAGTNHYLTHIGTMPPAFPERTKADVATFGEVSQINDPERMGRVRVTLPTYNDIETDWMNVVMPGAGARKGFVMLPDKGDKVLVILTQGNPGYGIVVGGLFGAGNLPEDGISGGRRVTRQSWYSPGGQMITLDDEGNTIRLQNESGAFIEMHGSQITITANRIDFRRIGLGQQLKDEAGDLVAAEASIRANLTENMQRLGERNNWIVIILIILTVIMILVLLIYILYQTYFSGAA